jgi:exodeoxyribonuclease-1
MTFVFYDTETTGLRIGFDQIVQFAAIKTDNDLNETERFEIRSRLLPYAIPHPKALLTNGLPIERLTDESLPSHYQMVLQLRRRLLEWSPAIFVGYNSIRFDEEMLRHALFQTLHPAYLTNSSQNCRADAMGLALSASALAPGVLQIPLGETGRPTFRLGDLAVANNILIGQSHDAMADAEATLGLCRLIKSAAPAVWQRFVRFSKKATVSQFVDDEDGFVLTEFYGNEAYHAPVVCLGTDPAAAGTRRLCLRLDVSVDDLRRISDEQLQAELSKKPSPIRSVRTNAAPTLTELFDATEEMLGGRPIEELEDLAHSIKDDRSLKDRLLANYLAARPEFGPADVPEQNIYASFPDDDDVYRLASFHDASWPDALRLAQGLRHEGLKTFGTRLVYCEARGQVPGDLRHEIERELMDRLTVETPWGFTIQQAISSIDELLAKQLDRKGILTGYREYLLDRQQKVAAHRARLMVPL